MKKLLLSVAVASTLGLSGCGGGDNIAEIKEQVIDNGQTSQPYSRVVFDPAKSKVSVPNDLLFSGTTDGTLQMPGETVPFGTMPDYTDPQTAIGALDGWSTSVPFSLAVDLNDDVTLEPSSIVGAVRIFEVTLGGPLSPAASCTEAPAISLCTMGDKELEFGLAGDFVTKIVGNSIVVIPMKPLKASQGYLVVMTNNLMDSNGNLVHASTTYESVRRDIETLPLPLPKQLGLQYLINSYENGAVAAGVDPDSIIYTAAFTTQSVDNVLEVVKGLMIKTGSVVITGLGAHPYGAGAGDILVASGKVAAGSDVANFANLADVRVAQLTTPYYLGEVTPETCMPSFEVPMPTPTNCAGLYRGFKAQGDSPVTVAGALQTGVLSQESFGAQFAAQAPFFGLTEYTQPSDLVGMTFTIDIPDVGKVPLDQARHLTKFNPVPAGVSNALDVIVTIPNVPGMDTPDTGWPVMIYSHGITMTKETVLAFAGSMAKAGIAVVAIDHPYHGSRGVDILGGKINASEGQVSAYFNLTSLLAARDNLRQSEADLLALRLALNSLDSAGVLSKTNISFYGHSLGGVTGIPFTALANSGLIVDFSTGAMAPHNPYAIKAASFLAPGGGVPGFLLESASFKGTVKDGLTASATFKQLLIDASGMTQVELDGLKVANIDAYNGLVDKVYGPFSSQFNFAAQTILDAGDAINYAIEMGTNTNAIHVMEVVGQEGVSPADLVIPNNTALPLSGTEPLARLMALTQASETVVADAEGMLKALVKFTAGHHSSLLRPNMLDGEIPTAVEVEVTTEMQTQLASFMASQGTYLPIVDSDIIAK